MPFKISWETLFHPRRVAARARYQELILNAPQLHDFDATIIYLGECIETLETPIAASKARLASVAEHDETTFASYIHILQDTAQSFGYLFLFKWAANSPIKYEIWGAPRIICRYTDHQRMNEMRKVTYDAMIASVASKEPSELYFVLKEFETYVPGFTQGYQTALATHRQYLENIPVLQGFKSLLDAMQKVRAQLADYEVKHGPDAAAEFIANAMLSRGDLEDPKPETLAPKLQQLAVALNAAPPPRSVTQSGKAKLVGELLHLLHDYENGQNDDAKPVMQNLLLSTIEFKAMSDPGITAASIFAALRTVDAAAYQKLEDIFGTAQLAAICQPAPNTLEQGAPTVTADAPVP